MNDKNDILDVVDGSYRIDKEKDKIKKNDDIKEKLQKMYNLADKVKGCFESVDDFSLFLKIFNEMGKTKSKDKQAEKIKKGA